MEVAGITRLIKYVGTTFALCTNHANFRVHSVVNNHTLVGTDPAYSKKHANRGMAEGEEVLFKTLMITRG